jgi:hypothetical protein
MVTKKVTLSMGPPQVKHKPYQNSTIFRRFILKVNKSPLFQEGKLTLTMSANQAVQND